jgi:type II secretory pathway pseudopilin PulG
MDRFSYQPFRVHLLHLSVFGGLFVLFMLAVFWAVLDAAFKPEEKQEEKAEEEPKEKKVKGPRFTLVELLVVIAIMGTLIGLLTPAVPAARGPARRMQCVNRMKQIVIAFHNYNDTYGHFPPAYTVDENGKPLHSWRVLMLPYLENKALYEKIRLDEPWDSEYNRQFHAIAPDCFRCPSCSPRFEARSEAVPVPSPGGCFYSVIDGAEAAFSGSQTKTPTPEELSSTLFLVERRTPVNWMDPSREIAFDVACKGINVDSMGISSYHPGGVNTAMGDASVKFVSETINGDALRAMLTLKKE